jgi:HSP20 family protein
MGNGIAFEKVVSVKFKTQKFNSMTLTKHNYRHFNNLFDELLTRTAFSNETGLTNPPVNIHETNEAYHLEVVAPGLNKEDIKVNFVKGILTISYEKKQTEEQKDYKTHRREFAFKSFTRSFTVDDKVNAENIQAKYNNGILHLLLPKKEEVKTAPKEITIL